MSEENDLDLITFGDENATLADLARLDWDSVEEKRITRFPRGIYVWEVVADPEPPKFQNFGGKGAVSFPLKCLTVLHCNDPADAPNGDPKELVGKIHRETFFLSNMMAAGFMKAFIADIGTPKMPDITQRLLATVGKRFAAPIILQKNPNDKDAEPYRKIAADKIVIVNIGAAQATKAA